MFAAPAACLRPPQRGWQCPDSAIAIRLPIPRSVMPRRAALCLRHNSEVSIDHSTGEHRPLYGKIKLAQRFVRPNTPRRKY
jgi:hypothetical protein